MSADYFVLLCLCVFRGECHVFKRLSLYLIDKVEGARLTLLEDPSNVLSKNAQYGELYTAEKENRRHD